MQFSFKFYLLKILLIWFDLIRSRRRVESISLICVNLILSLAEIICDEKGEIWYLMQSQWQENQFWKRIKSYISRLVAFVVVSVTLAVVVVVVTVEVILLKAELALAASSLTVSNISCLYNLHKMKLGAALRRNDANGVGPRLKRDRWKKKFPSKCYIYIIFSQWRRFITDYRGQGWSTQKITSTIIRQGWWEDERE